MGEALEYPSSVVRRVAEGERQARGCITLGEMNDIHDTYPWRVIGTLYIY